MSASRSPRLPEIGLRSDPERTVFYLNNASTTFNDQDAQFELAKLQLKGEGIETNVPLGKHWLSVLSYFLRKSCGAFAPASQV